MPTLIIRDLPAELHRRLKEEAQKAHRSMNREAIYLLEAGLSETKSLSTAHELPAPYRGKKPLTDKLIQQWKHAPIYHWAETLAKKKGFSHLTEADIVRLVRESRGR